MTVIESRPSAMPGPDPPRRTSAGEERPSQASRGQTAAANAIFQQPWWLDALAPNRWAEAVIERDGRTVARLPYVVRGRARLRMLTQPPLTQTLGPWIEPSGAKQTHMLSQEMKILGALEGALPSAHSFMQHFSPTLLNALPFYWAGYRIEVRYTYRLEDLSSEEAIWEGLRGSIRREIRKARKRVEIRDDLGLDRFHAVWAKTYSAQGIRLPTTLEQLARVDAACDTRDARAMLFAVDESDCVHAVAYVVWDEHAAYYLLGGGDPELRTSGAASMLMWESILRARRVTGVFDFEGSMLQPVERFFRAFGGRQTPYLRVSRSSVPAGAAMAIRTAARDLADRRRR